MVCASIPRRGEFAETGRTWVWFLDQPGAVMELACSLLGLTEIEEQSERVVVRGLSGRVYRVFQRRRLPTALGQSAAGDIKGSGHGQARADRARCPRHQAANCDNPEASPAYGRFNLWPARPR